MCTLCTRENCRSAGKWEACLAPPGELRSVSCSGQAARDRPLPGSWKCIGPAHPAVCLAAAGLADLGSQGDPLKSQEWRELSRRHGWCGPTGGLGFRGGIAPALEECFVVSGAKGRGIWFHRRLGEARRAVRTALVSFALPGKWDVASGVGWGCPAQARLWGVAVPSCPQQPNLATSSELSHGA